MNVRRSATRPSRSATSLNISLSARWPSTGSEANHVPDVDLFLHSIADGPVFFDTIVGEYGSQAATDWFVGRCGDARYRIVHAPGYPAVFNPLILRTERFDRDPRWTQMLDTAHGTALYRLAERFSAS